MDPTILQVLSTGGAWAVAIGVAVIALVPRKGSLENLRIDQLQEDLSAERAARQEQDKRIDRVLRINERYRKRDLAWQQLYLKVQRGVEDGTIPPWADLPPILEESVND